jgi:tetratricopeptide (TPR) repeat protein
LAFILSLSGLSLCGLSLSGGDQAYGDDLCSSGIPLGAIAAAQAATGDLDGAFKTTELIDVDDRDRALAGIAEVQTEAGNFAGALQTLSRIGDDWTEAETGHEIALAQADAGKLVDAGTTVRLIRNESYANFARRAIADHQVKAGDVDGALETLRGIPRPGSRIVAYFGIVNALADLGKMDEARRILDRELRPAVEIDDPAQRAIALRSLAVGLARIGEIEEALGIARGLDDPRERAYALQAIAEIHAEAGDRPAALGLLDEAATSAKSAAAPDQGDAILSHAAEGYSDIGDFDRAAAIAATVEDAGRRTQLFIEIGRQAASAGQPNLARQNFDAAWQSAGLPPDDIDRSLAAGAVIRARARTGDIEGALRLAHAMENPLDMRAALADIAETQAAAGDFDAALATANDIVNEEARADPDDLQMAKEHRAEALGGIARAEAQAGRIGEAKLLIKEALGQACGIDPDRTGAVRNGSAPQGISPASQ